MWWQVLPPLGLIGGLTLVIFYGPPAAHYLVFGVPQKKGVLGERALSRPHNLWYIRDRHMTGHSQLRRGLEHISDKPETKP